ncbi:glycogen debranching N-terminal domain-containing protein [Micromonospora craniellae]|uniref:Uncharacterized protein n=1 Tax=Micromonospora craniellae TaxID=2294034 RepID=A0A372G390_9ACTN|nr:glycogen debranching N-terminal domain-containing protein [Micromonospora craniellae]QOC92021.1 hypothetical protein ID554_29860 [Micromonospora craniellae]RFS47515.1 hypothetical protein D0Q02_05915 [Micromonospora craniellae]
MLFRGVLSVEGDLTLLNHAPAPTRSTMRLTVAADFAEVPEVRSGLQALPFIPARAARTLRILALTQGARDDPFRGEQPGKIVQECRYGDSAAFTPSSSSCSTSTSGGPATPDLVRGYAYEVRTAIAWLDGPADPQRTCVEAGMPEQMGQM